MGKKTQFSIWYIVIAIGSIVLLQFAIAAYESVVPLSYSEFRQYLEDGRIGSVTVTESRIRGSFEEPSGEIRQFVTNRVDPGIATELEQYGVAVSGGSDETPLTGLLSWIVPMLIFFGIWFFVFRRLIGRQGTSEFMSIGKSKAKVYIETDTKVTFADVAGVDEAKEELAEVVAFLKDPERYGRLGARLPKGILLVGPPGTGKTLLARAVAGEAGVPFFSISGSEFVELFVGIGAARVRDLFEQARAKAPAIIFIDELDALGRARGVFPISGGADEKEQTLNQLLAELDGFDPSRGLVLLAATNRPEILDPALLRAGRFDRQVLVDRPDRTGRIDILKVHLRKAKIGTDVDSAQIAALTPGFTGADLANLVNEAALLATRRNAGRVEMQDFTAGIERIVAGLEKKNRLLNPLERRIVAHHEMGHALIALTQPGGDVVHKVSIIPRGIGSLGYTIQRPTEDRYLMTREELERKMTTLLGGRAAEHIVFDHLSTGAADDLAKVTDIARAMVTRYGMAPELGHVTYDRDPQPFLGTPVPHFVGERQYSEETAREIDCAVKTLVDAAFQQAVAILTERRAVLEEGARRLLLAETLGEAELRELVGMSAADVREAASPATAH
ncbi:MAG: ATP-dependent zinc metalloprotease FtsH [Rhodospirillaceae bacterium]|nr:ATP-dependent zinc metalloprotease FtsH [Rhodospirillaceae bacterium]